MAERDFISDVFTLTYKGVLDFDALYKTMHGWFKQRRYTLRELDYKEYKERGQKNLSIKWEARRNVTDYVMYVIEFSVNLNNITDVVVKKKPYINTSFSARIAAYLQKDYEEQWSRKPFLKFIREVYDKYLAGSRTTALRRELEEEMRAFRNELKACLHLHKINT